MLQYQYEKVTSVEEGVRRLLTVRDVEIPEFELLRRPEGYYTDVLVYDGKKIPLFPKRYDPRMNNMRGYGMKAVYENCILNTISFAGNDVSLDEIMYYELDLAEYVLGTRVTKITAFINGGACNLLAKTENGAVAGLELGATMAPGTIPQINHRLITKHGAATDRTVNNVVEQSGVYLFSASDPRPVAYDDGEYYLYGLTVEESMLATFIQAVLLGRISADALIEQDKHLRELLLAAHKSAECGKSVPVSAKEAE